MDTAVVERTAHELVAAIAAQDWDRLEACFAAEARFFAAVPSENPFRERVGAKEAAGQLAAWFGDGDPLELVSSESESIAGKLRISYRFRSFEKGEWLLVEQHAFCEVGARGIEQMHVVCSGFIPVT